MRFVKKLLLVPLYLMVVIALIPIKLAVWLYSMISGICIGVLSVLAIATIICYHDVFQVIFIMIIAACCFAVLFGGVALEEILCMVRRRITEHIVS